MYLDRREPCFTGTDHLHLQGRTHILLYSEDRDIRFLRNISKYPLEYTASRLTRQYRHTHTHMVWQLSSRNGAAEFTSGDDETNYCDVSVVLLLTNRWQVSANPTTDSSWVASQWVCSVFNCCSFLAMQQRVNNKFRFKLGKIFQLSMLMKP
jgi:hypothetical protein